MSFEKPYLFIKDGVTVVIKHRHGGYIRCNNKGEIFGDGKTGIFAHWKISLKNNGTQCTLESIKFPGKYLRMGRLHRFVDATGGGGPFCLWNIKKIGNGKCKLESNRFGGHYLAVNGVKQCKVGEGLINCELELFREGQKQVIIEEKKQENIGNIVIKKVILKQYTKPYYFLKNSRIILVSSNLGGVLNVGNNKILDGFGGEIKASSLFDCEVYNDHVSFKNEYSKGYLRIYNLNGLKIDAGGFKGGEFTKFTVIKTGETVKIRSLKFPKAYIAMSSDNKVAIGMGGPFCVFYAKRIEESSIKIEKKVNPIQPNINSNSNKFKHNYIFAINNIIVILKTGNGKTIRCSPMNTNKVDSNGGEGIYAQWKVHLLGNGICSFENMKTSKFLRIFNGVVDCQGMKGGPLVKFKIIKENNGYKFQSVKNGQYIAAKGGAVAAGKGGPFCLLHVLK